MLVAGCWIDVAGCLHSAHAHLKLLLHIGSAELRISEYVVPVRMGSK